MNAILSLYTLQHISR